MLVRLVEKCLNSYSNNVSRYLIGKESQVSFRQTVFIISNDRTFYYSIIYKTIISQSYLFIDT